MTNDALHDVLRELRRDPDIDGPNLVAHDATDRLLLSVAADQLASARAGDVAVIGDRYGALTLGAVHAFNVPGVRVHQDGLIAERALGSNAARIGLVGGFAHHGLGPNLLTHAKLVIVQLPKSIDALREIADAVARYAHPSVTLLAGGRVKHMTLAMNAVLEEFFTDVRAGLARQKSRVVTATGLKNPRGGSLPPPPFPVWGRDPDLDFSLAAFGATFGGARLDHGTRLLLDTLPDGAGANRVVDLGCGNGSIAVAYARRHPEASVIATDQSAAAVNAARLTAQAAGVADRVTVVRADATEEVPTGWAELILLNPPFHDGTAVNAGIGHRLIASCARALAPGGELRTVFNSHLRYRSVLAEHIGPVRQVARNRTFTVLAATNKQK